MAIYVISVFRLMNCASNQRVYVFYTVLRIKADHLARGNLPLGVRNIRVDGDSSKTNLICAYRSVVGGACTHHWYKRDLGPTQTPSPNLKRRPIFVVSVVELLGKFMCNLKMASINGRNL